MATVLKPRLLICDEPTTALDVTTQAQILKLLKALAREQGCGLILITHDLAVVAEMADRTVILKDGAIVEQGPTVPLFRGLKNSYSRQLAADSAPAPAKPRPLPQEEAPVETEAPTITPDDSTPSPAEAPIETPTDPGFDSFPDVPTDSPYSEGDATEPPFTQPETTEDPAVDPGQDYPEMDSGIPE